MWIVYLFKYILAWKNRLQQVDMGRYFAKSLKQEKIFFYLKMRMFRSMVPVKIKTLIIGLDVIKRLNYFFFSSANWLNYLFSWKMGPLQHLSLHTTVVFQRLLLKKLFSKYFEVMNVSFGSRINILNHIILTKIHQIPSQLIILLGETLNQWVE